MEIVPLQFVFPKCLNYVKECLLLLLMVLCRSVLPFHEFLLVLRFPGKVRMYVFALFAYNISRFVDTVL